MTRCEWCAATEPAPGYFAPQSPSARVLLPAVHSAQGWHVYFPLCPRWSYPQESFPLLTQFSSRSFLIRETLANNQKQALSLPFSAVPFFTAHVSTSSICGGRKQKCFSLFSLVELSSTEVQTQFVLLTVFPAPNPYTFVEWIFRESL